MQLRDLASVAVIFVIAGISLGIGAQVLTSITNKLDATAYTARSAVGNATLGMGELGSWLPTIGLVIAAALIITIIFASFGGRM